tara:strand:+ start:4378 stop:4977 length:600 start_codon:yes stop_codon:yes gene_type:complete
MVKKIMEVNKDLHSYITTFDNILEQEALDCLIKICKKKEFEKATIYTGGEKKILNEKIRKTENISLSALQSKSMTDVHWSNYLNKIFCIFIKDYIKLNNLKQNLRSIFDIQLLKYTLGGHYIFHTDDTLAMHRIYSCVFLINDDYEGGELAFKYPKSDEILKVEKKKNRLIIFPSNFLYPHTVLPVTKGERYSVVAWAL